MSVKLRNVLMAEEYATSEKFGSPLATSPQTMDSVQFFYTKITQSLSQA
jgi:hypothetical protein